MAHENREEGLGQCVRSESSPVTCRILEIEKASEVGWELVPRL